MTPRTLLAVIAAALGPALPAAVTAQSGEWPTLQRMGIEYLSRSGNFQVTLSGQLDIEALHVSNGWSDLVSLEGGSDILASQPTDCSRCHGDEPLTSGGGELWAHRLRLFADVFAGDHVYSMVELRADRGESPTNGKGRVRVEQAFLRVGDAEGARWMQAGLFASPFGSYSLRHLSVVDPFVRPPLAYDYRTMMSRIVVPADATRLLEWKHEPGDFRWGGVPPVWDVPYQWGLMGFVRAAGVDVRAAAMNSAPSSAPDAWWGLSWDRLRDPTWVLAARARPPHRLGARRVVEQGPVDGGVHGADRVGARLPRLRSGDRGGGRRLRARRHDDARGSDARPVGRAQRRRPADRGDLSARGTARSVRRRLPRGSGGAHRLPADRPTGAAGVAPEDWDHDVTRLEASVGYRLARNAGVLLSAFEQRQRGASDAEGRLVGARLWWAF